MEKNQAVQVLIQVAQQALGAGLFKTFNDVEIVKNAVDALQTEEQTEVAEK